MNLSIKQFLDFSFCGQLNTSFPFLSVESYFRRFILDIILDFYFKFISKIYILKFVVAIQQKKESQKGTPGVGVNTF